MQIWLLAAAIIRVAAPDQDAQHALNAQLGALNLRTASGAALALQRMTDAAKAYCEAGAPGVYDVTTLKCRRDMVGRAVKQLNVPEISAAFEATSTEAPPAPPPVGRR